MKPYNKEGATKADEVREMFNTIAPAYDRLNHILSMQIDKIWRRRVVKLVKRYTAEVEGIELLDLATGTADLAIALSRAIPSAKVVGADPSQGMLDVGAGKVAAAGLSERVTLEVQSAESLNFESDRFAATTAAFGVRNYSDLRGGIAEMVRVTRPAGWVVILEFSTPPNPIFRWFYNLYSRHILPRIGALLSKDRAAYEYLPASVEEFASPREMVEMMRDLGLDSCMAISQSFGIAQIYVGEKK